jgi:hypothetical protein
LSGFLISFSLSSDDTISRLHPLGILLELRLFIFPAACSSISFGAVQPICLGSKQRLLRVLIRRNGAGGLWKEDAPVRMCELTNELETFSNLAAEM